MSGRSGMMLLVAIVCGLGAMYGAQRLTARDETEEETREVLTAARNLQVEEILTPDLVKVIKVPVSRAPVGSFASFKDVAERWVRIPLLAGETIVDAKLAPKGSPLGLLARIPLGKRAYAIEVDEQSGVAGFIMPEHHVDVLLSRGRSGNARGRMKSEIVLQDVLVLAAGNTVNRPDDPSIQVKTVTLAVTPDQAATLAAAQTEGTLLLSLRGHNDRETVPLPEPEPEAEPEVAPVPVPVPVPAPVVASEPPPAEAGPSEPSESVSVVIFHGPHVVEQIRRVSTGGAQAVSVSRGQESAVAAAEPSTSAATPAPVEPASARSLPVAASTPQIDPEL